MKLNTTLVRISPEDAMALAAKENTGLLGKLAASIKGAPPAVEVLDAELFYYPLCVGGGVLDFPRAAHLPSKRIASLAVVDCAFGYVQRMQGTPETQTVDVDGRHVVKRMIDDKEAHERLASFMRKQGFRKYRALAEVEFKEFYLVYKPHYVCRCRRKDKEFLRIVDAEIGQRDFMLDIKYKDLHFERP